MTVFEYKVVPAPTRGLKAKGVKGTPARFANALETVMNELGADGWEYQRTDTLPVEERQGLTGKTSSFQNMLVFRRTIEETVQEEPVVGLIENQTQPAAPVAAVVESADAPVEAEAEVDADVQEIASPANEDAAVTEETPSPEARDRVAETLKSDGYTFPWNNRRKAAARAETVQPSADEVS